MFKSQRIQGILVRTALLLLLYSKHSNKNHLLSLVKQNAFERFCYKNNNRETLQCCVLESYYDKVVFCK